MVRQFLQVIGILAAFCSLWTAFLFLVQPEEAASHAISIYLIVGALVGGAAAFVDEIFGDPGDDAYPTRAALATTVGSMLWLPGLAAIAILAFSLPAYWTLYDIFERHGWLPSQRRYAPDDNESNPYRSPGTY